MEKTTNKLWIVLTMGMICIFIFSSYANRAVRRSIETKEQLDLLKASTDLMSASVNALDQRVRALEKLNTSSASNDTAVPRPQQTSSLQLLTMGNQPELLNEGGAIDHIEIETKTDGDSKIQKQKKKPTFSNHLKTYRDSLNKEQLTALEKRVDEVFFSTFYHSIEHINLSDEQKEQLLNSIDAEQLELIRQSHEEGILMQMMAEAIK